MKLIMFIKLVQLTSIGRANVLEFYHKLVFMREWEDNMNREGKEAISML